MIEPNRLHEISDRIEIQDFLTRYCTAIDAKKYEMLDSVFTQEAIIDYTAAGGIRGKLPEIKAWLSKALGQFPMTQHIVTNFDIRIEGDHATSRCVFFNPMELPPAEGEKDQQMLFYGGYYNDTLVRTNEGWRISERVEELSWTYGKLPKDFEIPQ